MSDSYVHPVGDPIEDDDGMRMIVGVDYDTVTISGSVRLDAAQAEDFGALFVNACWQAGRQHERMIEAREALAAGDPERGASGDAAGNHQEDEQ